MSTNIKPKRTPNHSSWRYVDKREPFQGSSLRGEDYTEGLAPSFAGSWLNDHEVQMYGANQPRITYIVWSFWTPIAYYVEGTGWYKVGQSFSSFTSRHRSGALRNVPGHMVRLAERRGDNVVECLDCGTTRHFTHVKDAREAYWCHR